MNLTSDFYLYFKMEGVCNMPFFDHMKKKKKQESWSQRLRP